MRTGRIVLTVTLVFGAAAVGLSQKTAAGMVACWNRYGEVIYAAATRHAVPPALALSVAYWESGCDPTRTRYEPHVALWPSVRSHPPAERKFRATSFGLFQVLGVTARSMGYTGTPEQFRQPAINAEYGIRYLAAKHQQYGNWSDALAAYNGGHGAVLRRHHIGTYGLSVEKYVRGVLALKRLYAEPIIGAWRAQVEEGAR